LVRQHVRGHALQAERVDRGVEGDQRPRTGAVPGGGRLDDRGDDLLWLVVGVGALDQDLPAAAEVPDVGGREVDLAGGEDRARRGGGVHVGRRGVPRVRRRAGQVSLGRAFVL